jgi:hypothetical protein
MEIVDDMFLTRANRTIVFVELEPRLAGEESWKLST